MEDFIMILRINSYSQYLKAFASLFKCQRLIIVGILLSVLLCPHTSYSAYLTQAWVAPYNGPGNGGDRAVALKADNLGNVYVTGTDYSGSSFDYATVKYNTDGNQLWVARYNGPGNGYDNATALSVDNAGNVYVTGETDYNTSNSNIATVKYDTNGNQVWAAIYNGPANNYDSPRGLVSDGSGNVYVTGTTCDRWYCYIVTIKYDVNGTQLWANKRTTSGDPSSIEIDNNSNVVVRGTTGVGYTTIMYDANGNERWTSTGGIGNGEAITTDLTGNVFVTGGVRATEFANDILTTKYDQNGKVWEVRFDLNQGNDRSHAIAVDNAGNVYVTGEIGSQTYHDFITVKYDNNGRQLWATSYSCGDDYSRSIAVDEAGNVYVTGYCYATSSDYITVKYDTTGVQQWVARYNGPDSRNDQAFDIDVDPIGNVYVTGYRERARATTAS